MLTLKEYQRVFVKMLLLIGSYFYRSTTELNIPITIKYRKSKGANRNGWTNGDRMSARNAAPEIFQAILL